MAAPHIRSVPAARSEEGAAATTIALGLSAAVGGMAGGIGLINGSELGWLVLPTIGLLAGLGIGRRVLAAWAGLALWVGILPHASADAMLGPILMIVVCLAIAIGPDRLLAIVRRDLTDRAPPSDGRSAPEPAVPAGWIEDA